jgi:hypothetical protein
MGTKGSWKRPSQISEAELDLRWELAFGGPRRHSEHIEIVKEECSWPKLESGDIELFLERCQPNVYEWQPAPALDELSALGQELQPKYYQIAPPPTAE